MFVGPICLLGPWAQTLRRPWSALLSPLLCIYYIITNMDILTWGQQWKKRKRKEIKKKEGYYAYTNEGMFLFFQCVKTSTKWRTALWCCASVSATENTSRRCAAKRARPAPPTRAVCWRDEPPPPTHTHTHAHTHTHTEHFTSILSQILVAGFNNILINWFLTFIITQLFWFFRRDIPKICLLTLIIFASGGVGGIAARRPNIYMGAPIGVV